MKRTKYTVWLAYDPKKHIYSLNHIENGWAEKASKPQPKHKDQEVWNGIRWAQRFTYFDEQMREVP